MFVYSPPTGSRSRVRPASPLPRPRSRPPEVPLAVQLFPADGVTWVVSLPTGLATDTVWPDMEWIEALALVPEEAETEMPEEVCAR